MNELETDCYNMSFIQRPIDDRLEFCKKRKYGLDLNTDPAWELFTPKIWAPFLKISRFLLKLNGILDAI
jgi:hypothetical protein